MVGLFGGLLSAAGTIVDSIVVVSLAVFMAIDRDKIMRVGLDLTPPEKREDVMLFRRSVGFGGGRLHAQPARPRRRCTASGPSSSASCSACRSAPATAFLSGLIMAIPIYGPYVSWLPPVVVAALVGPRSRSSSRWSC